MEQIQSKYLSAGSWKNIFLMLRIAAYIALLILYGYFWYKLYGNWREEILARKLFGIGLSGIGVGLTADFDALWALIVGGVIILLATTEKFKKFLFISAFIIFADLAASVLLGRSINELELFGVWVGVPVLIIILTKVVYSLTSIPPISLKWKVALFLVALLISLLLIFNK